MQSLCRSADVAFITVILTSTILSLVCTDSVGFNRPIAHGVCNWYVQLVLTSCVRSRFAVNVTNHWRFARTYVTNSLCFLHDQRIAVLTLNIISITSCKSWRQAPDKMKIWTATRKSFYLSHFNLLKDGEKCLLQCLIHTFTCGLKKFPRNGLIQCTEVSVVSLKSLFNLYFNTDAETCNHSVTSTAIIQLYLHVHTLPRSQHN